nr:2,3-bisphosphoglycerate-dependent phosphoglycerate mutase [Ipomoea batatas]
MATAAYQVLGAIQSGGCISHSSFQQDSRSSASLKLISKGVRVDVGFGARGSHCLKKRSFGVIQATASPTAMFDVISSPSSTTTNDSKKKTKEAALILIRHGESMWNEKNLFTGCVDVPLTKKGVDEAIEAGRRISNIPVDMIYTSSLIRAQMTAMLAMTQHRRKKVPIITHNESEQARSWSQIFSEETNKQCIPVVTAWQLNERIAFDITRAILCRYGELQGLNKQETADRYGKEQVHEWRRSYDIPPPNGESLEMCAERAVAYFKENIVPQLDSGKNVMIAAHGNSLRSIIMYLDKLTSEEVEISGFLKTLVISLELSTGIPMLYIFKEGRFLRRGSPAGPTEAGVYAYTKLNCVVCLCVHDLCMCKRGVQKHMGASEHDDEYNIFVCMHVDNVLCLCVHTMIYRYNYGLYFTGGEQFFGRSSAGALCLLLASVFVVQIFNSGDPFPRSRRCFPIGNSLNRPCERSYSVSLYSALVA